MTANPTSYEWIKEMKSELLALDKIPLTGSAPSFPWKELSSRIGQSFEEKEIEIIPGEITWRTKDKLYEGLGDFPFPLILGIPSMSGSVAWVMPEQEIVSLESLLLTKEDHPLTFQDRSLSEAFYRFLALEVLYNINQVAFDKSLTPILSKNTAPIEEDALCWDISIVIRKQTLWGRLIISQELRQSWVDHFAKISHTSPLSQEIAQQAETVVHLEIGKTQLTLHDWSQINEGDWVGLDQFSLDPEFHSGRVMLTVHGKNAFIGRLKEGNIKIVEFPLYHEVETPMANHSNDDEDFEDLDDLTNENDDFELDTNFDLEDDFLEEEGTQEDIEETDGAGVPQKQAPQKPAGKEEISKKMKSEGKESVDKRLSAKDIPISLTVEIGRLQMTMEKLLLLEPGNILDLNIQPENGVDLIINGKNVGRGELVKIGESIGVRILEIGR